MKSDSAVFLTKQLQIKKDILKPLTETVIIGKFNQKIKWKFATDSKRKP